MLKNILNSNSSVKLLDLFMTNILIKLRSITKHTSHTFDLRNIPTTYILIKFSITKNTFRYVVIYSNIIELSVHNCSVGINQRELKVQREETRIHSY